MARNSTGRRSAPARLASLTWQATKHGHSAGRLWPLLILTVLVTGRWWAQSASPLLVIGAALGVSGAVAVYLTGKLTHPTDMAYAGTCLGSMTLGLTLVSLIGTPQWLNVACVIGWAGLSLVWWVHEERPAAAPVIETPERLPRIIADWNAHVRDRQGSTGGAQITDSGPFEHGNDYLVQVVPGKQHLGTFESAMPVISTALDVPMHKLLLEKHPDFESPRALRLRHVTRSPIEEAVYFTGPVIKDGHIRMGPYADGMGAASWRLFTTNSMWNGFVLGDIGSGKTRLLELIALAARSIGVFIIYIDGQSGASSPTLWQYADWRGGPDEANEILSALERAKDKRQIYNRVHGLSGFTHSLELPGRLTIIDECHKIYEPGTAHRWANLGREDRKTGGGQVAASQFSGLQTFGGYDVLRSSLFAGNCVALRTSSTISAQLVPGLDLNPAMFPKLPGYGYYVDSSGQLRTAPFRCEYLPDEDDKLRDPSIPVPTVEEWFARTPPVALDEMTASAFGPAYLNRHELATQRDAADRAWLDGNGDPEDEPGFDFKSPIEAMAYLVKKGVIGAGEDAEIPADPETVQALSEAQRIEDERRAAEVADAAAAIDLLLDSQSSMSLADIINGLANTGRHPTVFTVRAALTQLANRGRVERDGPNYRRVAA